MNYKTLLAAAMLMAAPVLSINAEQTAEKETNGSTTTLNDVVKAVAGVADKIQINGYAQGGYEYSSKDNSNTFDFKRTIVWAKAQITDKWSFLYMHDFKASSLEYYTAYSFDKAFNVRMGQFKNSLSMENAMSPSKLELVNCYSQPVMWMTGFTDPLIGPQGGRDLGLLFYGEAGNTGLKYELGIMNGQGINVKDGNREKDFILKLDYKLVPSLRIVTSGQIGRGHAIKADESRNIAEGQNYKRDRLTAGFEYASKPLTVRGEWLKGWDDAIQSQGVYVTAQSPVCKKVDAVASFDWLDKNTKANMRQANYTIGLQYWFFNKCRIQAQYTRSCPSFGKDYNVIQVQTQVGF